MANEDTKAPTEVKSEEILTVKVEEFDYAAYEESTGRQSVPSGAFYHVETALDNGVREGMVVEIRLPGQEELYWLACIESVFGPLVKLSYVGDDKGTEIWYDLNKNRLYPLGWCQMNKYPLEPPQRIQESCPQWQDLSLQYLEDGQIETIPMHHIDGDGVTAIERLKPGMVLDIQSDTDPNVFWFARIRENHGGLLTLVYAAPTIPPDEMTLELFYSSPKLFPFKFAHNSSNKTYVPPSGIEKIFVSQTTKVNDFVNAFLCGKHRHVPIDVITVVTPAVEHNFKKNDHLEIIHPMNGLTLEEANVTKIHNSNYFDVTLIKESGVKLMCNASASNIFPVGQLKLLGDNQNVSTRRKLASKDKFPKRETAEERGFEVDHLLEVHYGRDFFIGIIKEIHSSVLKIELLDGKGHVRLFPCDDLRLFPSGWSGSNTRLLTVLQNMIPPSPKIDIVEEKATESSPTPPPVPESSSEKSTSSWCPTIYFNYRCYSASFLSRARLASLPRSVGPAPVRLVMHSVLQLLVGSSFKSGSVLKRLECKTEHPRPGFHIQTIKGKSRVLNLKGEIEVPTRADQVEGYCREICQKLGACPFLIHTTNFSKEDECPARCQTRPKADFHPEDAEKKGPKRGPGKRRRVENSQTNGGGGGGSSSTDESEARSTAPPSQVHSRSPSPEQPASRKRQSRNKWARLLPKMEIRTRKAKLPNYKLHMKIRPTKKEMRVIENTEIRQSIGFKSKPGRKRKYASDIPIVGHPMNRLGPAFQLSDIPSADEEEWSPSSPSSGTPSTAGGPPPIRRIILESNPDRWRPADVARFLAKSGDCAHLSEFMVQDEIDGSAFMMLNYPTVKEYWSLKVSTAIALCRHIESVKLAYLCQYYRLPSQ